MRLLVVAGPSEVPSGLPAHQRVPLQDLERSQPECDTALVLGDTARLARAIAALPAGTAIAFGGAIEVARLLAVDPSPKAAVDRLRAGHRYPVDLGWLSLPGGRRLPFLAGVVAGAGARRRTGFPWAGREGEVVVRIDDRVNREGRVRALLLSNLQHWGPWTVSPRSAPNDGKLEVQGFAGGRVALWRLRRLLPTGMHGSLPTVWRSRGVAADATVPARWVVSADGVPAGRGPFSVALEPLRGTILI